MVEYWYASNKLWVDDAPGIFVPPRGTWLMHDSKSYTVDGAMVSFVKGKKGSGRLIRVMVRNGHVILRD